MKAKRKSKLVRKAAGKSSAATKSQPRRKSTQPPDWRAKEVQAELPLSLSKKAKARALRVVSAIEARRSEEQELAFSPREFVLCGLPYKRLKGAEYVRRNGALTFKVVADSKFGIPFGQDRLLPIWLATAFKAVGQPADNTIQFRSASDILRAFELPINGMEMRQLRGRIGRVFGATFFGWDERKGADFLSGNSYRLISKLDLWFGHKSAVNQHTLWRNTIKLDAQFADDLRAAAIPVDFGVVRALKGNPGALDLYVWQAHRSWCLDKARAAYEVDVPIFGPMGLLAQFGSVTKEPSKARQLLRRHQKLVETVWPECPNKLSRDGNAFILRRAVALKKATVTLPGVSARPPVVPLFPDAEGSIFDRMFLERADPPETL